jgi:hypothetical protein
MEAVKIMLSKWKTYKRDATDFDYEQWKAHLRIARIEMFRLEPEQQAAVIMILFKDHIQNVRLNGDSDDEIANMVTRIVTGRGYEEFYKLRAK